MCFLAKLCSPGDNEKRTMYTLPEHVHQLWSSGFDGGADGGANGSGVGAGVGGGGASSRQWR